ncbi:hypothetical protein V8F33_001845 [Rhypophila sp. PSN 637]
MTVFSFLQTLFLLSLIHYPFTHTPSSHLEMVDSVVLLTLTTPAFVFYFHFFTIFQLNICVIFTQGLFLFYTLDIYRIFLYILDELPIKTEDFDMI